MRATVIAAYRPKASFFMEILTGPIQFTTRRARRGSLSPDSDYSRWYIGPGKRSYGTRCHPLRESLAATAVEDHADAFGNLGPAVAFNVVDFLLVSSTRAIRMRQEPILNGAKSWKKRYSQHWQPSRAFWASRSGICIGNIATRLNSRSPEAYRVPGTPLVAILLAAILASPKEHRDLGASDSGDGARRHGE